MLRYLLKSSGNHFPPLGGSSSHRERQMKVRLRKKSVVRFERSFLEQCEKEHGTVMI